MLVTYSETEFTPATNEQTIFVDCCDCTVSAVDPASTVAPEARKPLPKIVTEYEPSVLNAPTLEMTEVMIGVTTNRTGEYCSRTAGEVRTRSVYPEPEPAGAVATISVLVTETTEKLAPTWVEPEYKPTITALAEVPARKPRPVMVMRLPISLGMVDAVM